MSHGHENNSGRKITIFRARKVRTMNPSMPVADAVAVREGRILEVGTIETMKPWMDAHPHEIDDRFIDGVMLPGFIDPHIHPAMAALLLPMHFITAMEWKFPWQTHPAVAGEQAFLDRLRDVESGLRSADEPLFSWGYHPLWHGAIDRRILNAISRNRPIIVWHRGFHSLFVNDAAIEWMGLDKESAARHPQIDLDKGVFFETGLGVALRYLNPYLSAPERLAGGLARFRDAVHSGGITTVGDMAAGVFLGAEKEWDASVAVLETDDTPFRVQMVPSALPFSGGSGIDADRIAELKSMPARNTHRLRYSNSVKMFADGGFFSNLMQLKSPGRIDGSGGEWMTPPEIFEETAQALWHAGFVIHVHCSADLGVELALDTLEKLQWERPRRGRTFVLEHFGVSTPEQVRRMVDLGAHASVNVYYVHELSDRYWKHILGHERASQMSRLGTLALNGIRFALHSDFTMAPAMPLYNAWVAATRIAETGQVMGPTERITVEQALRAITIDAAYILGLDDEVGSIRAGKKADFTVLASDPLECAPEELKDIPIMATVFEGRCFEIAK